MIDESAASALQSSSRGTSSLSAAHGSIPKKDTARSAGPTLPHQDHPPSTAYCSRMSISWWQPSSSSSQKLLCNV